MKVVFYGNRKGNFVDKAIRWWTSSFKEKLNGAWRDSYSHCEILFSDGQMFSASEYENLTRFKQHSYSDAWVAVDINVSYQTELLVRGFCRSVEGAKYDYLGILGFILGNSDSSQRWFCSEVCTRALQEIGMVEELRAARTSPNNLYKCLNKQYG